MYALLMSSQLQFIHKKEKEKKKRARTRLIKQVESTYFLSQSLYLSLKKSFSVSGGSH